MEPCPQCQAPFLVEKTTKRDGTVWSCANKECGYLEKHRNRYTGQVSVETKTLDVKDKIVIIFDDIISTGGTIIAAAKILKELGAEKVFAACAHPLLIGDAEKQILEAGVEEIVGTDSVPSHVSKVSLAPLIGKELAR